MPEKQNAKYRQRPIVVEAFRWYAHDDDDRTDPIIGMFNSGAAFLMPEQCDRCKQSMLIHGWVEGATRGNTILCPGDWVVKGVDGAWFTLPHAIFAATYEPVEP